jgi:pyridinium-3,5-biscarboxylic acid mononucleotide sulfurtransferase
MDGTEVDVVVDRLAVAFSGGSRIPHFSDVTPEKLAQVEQSEAGLRRLGLTDLRVRHHGDAARVELTLADPAGAVSAPVREAVHAAVQDAGFRFAAVDVAGIQSGAFTLPLVRAAGV